MSGYSYKEALEAAGAKVLAFESSTGWQGSWAALVEFEGKRGWVVGDFGSCSGCDAYEAEFGFNDRTPEKLAEFGRGYLLALLSQAEAEERADLERDDDFSKFVREAACGR